MLLKYFLLWFPMIVMAILNGTAREWYIQFTGEMAGYRISTITLIIFFGFYIYWATHKYPLSNETEAVIVGFMWLVLTLIFEFGFGLYLGRSWSELLAEYNILEGRLWILIPIWITVAPYIFYKLYQKET